jgi:hypothetical protein
MLSNLEGIEQYNNIAPLLGLDGLDGLDGNEEFMGELMSLPPLKRMRVLSKLVHQGANSRGSRAEMEKFFGELPAHIKEGLARGDLRLADTIIYSIKHVNSKTIKLFETQDDKETGMRNVSNAKLPKNQAFIVSGIILLAGVPNLAGATPTTIKDRILATKYEGIENYAALANGEFSLKSNKKQIVPETSNNVFKNANMHTLPIGYYKLDNPRVIHDDIQIEMTIELGSMEGLSPDTHIYAGLHGTITTP